MFDSLQVVLLAKSVVLFSVGRSKIFNFVKDALLKLHLFSLPNVPEYVQSQDYID